MTDRPPDEEPGSSQSPESNRWTDWTTQAFNETLNDFEYVMRCQEDTASQSVKCAHACTTKSTKRETSLSAVVS